MGLFDKILNGAKEVIDGTKTAIEKIENDMDQDVNQYADNKKLAGKERYDNPPEALPPVSVQTYLNGNNVQFMISDDFTKGEGYMNSVISFKYNPEHFGVLDDIYDEENITISLQEGVGDFDEIAECIEEYISNGSVSDVEQFEDYPDGKYMFKVKMLASDYELYYYVLRSDVEDSYDHDVLLLFYPYEVKGTNLEKKLLSCFDEVAKSLTIQFN
ncbi:MAG: hypothetical protein K6E10_06020 [Eubacterium sp.]|nr:hypothetical protein [Eubacterium sp.]